MPRIMKPVQCAHCLCVIKDGEDFGTFCPFGPKQKHGATEIELMALGLRPRLREME